MWERTYRDKVARLTKELAETEKKEGQERRKLNKLRSEADKLRAEAARTTSPAMARSKESQARPRDRQAEQVQRKMSNLQATAARKLQELTKAKADLKRAEEAARGKQDREKKKRRDAQIRHERELAARSTGPPGRPPFRQPLPNGSRWCSSPRIPWIRTGFGWTRR